MVLSFVVILLYIIIIIRLLSRDDKDQGFSFLSLSFLSVQNIKIIPSPFFTRTTVAACCLVGDDELGAVLRCLGTAALSRSTGTSFLLFMFFFITLFL
jgi:hypothetical protein